MLTALQFFLSFTLFSETSSSSEPAARDHTQLALAEIFAGPRPHFRSPSLTQSGAPSTALDSSDSSRSYFSAPNGSSTISPGGRGRSHSSAPILLTTPVPSSMASPNPSLSSAASTRSSSQQADQNGYRPTLSSFYSSSLPADIANPIRIGSSATSSDGAFRQEQSPPPNSRLRNYGPASYAGPSGGLSGYDATGWRPSPTPRQSSFGGAWEDEREGRSRARQDDPSRPWGERDASVSSAGTGIGLSNMSPFTRDGGRTLAEMADGAYKARREYSLGAVGSGRKRGESVWGSTRPLREAEDEDADDAFAPTRSGATSRRHSVAAFNAPSRSQFGFSIPDDSVKSNSTLPTSGFGSIGRTTNGGARFGTRSSAINDDDLAADLNSLHLNLEAHAAATESSSNSHRNFAPVGSMPINYPQSRPFDSTAKSTPTSQIFPPPTPSEIFSPPLAGGAASRFFQPTTTTNSTPPNGTRSSSRFEFGGISSSPSSSTPVLGAVGNHGDFSHGPYRSQSQQPPIDNRFLPSFGMPPPSPPNSFFSAPLSPHGLSAQALPFQTFSHPPPPPPGTNMLPQLFPPSPSVNGPGQPSPHLMQGGQDLSNLGRGIPLHTVPAHAPLYIVEFKAGRKDLFFVEDTNLQLRQGDLVIVEADRGKVSFFFLFLKSIIVACSVLTNKPSPQDIGKYFKPCSLDEVHAFQQRLVEMALGQLANPGTGNAPPNPTTIARMTKEFAPKKIFGKAQPSDTQMLLSKAQDEVKALALIRTKVQQKSELDLSLCLRSRMALTITFWHRRFSDGSSGCRMAMGSKKVDLLFHSVAWTFSSRL